MNKFTAILIFTCVTVIMLILGSVEEDDQAMQLENYCQMVELNIQSDGVHGWPDYKNIYSDQCENREGL